MPEKKKILPLFTAPALATEAAMTQAVLSPQSQCVINSACRMQMGWAEPCHCRAMDTVATEEVVLQCCLLWQSLLVMDGSVHTCMYVHLAGVASYRQEGVLLTVVP